MTASILYQQWPAHLVALPGLWAPGRQWFLGVCEWTFGALLLAGFWDKRLGVLGAIGSTATFIATAPSSLSCRTVDADVAYSLRDAAQHWRNMAARAAAQYVAMGQQRTYREPAWPPMIAEPSRSLSDRHVAVGQQLTPSRESRKASAGSAPE